MSSNTYEIEKRGGEVETIRADSVKEARYKVSFFIHHERKREPDPDLDPIMYMGQEPPETVTVRELIAEYALSQIVGWKKKESKFGR